MKIAPILIISIDVLKLFSGILSLYFGVITFGHFIQAPLQKKKFLAAFYIFFALFSFMSFVSRFIPAWKLGAVGITFFFSLLGNLALALYCIDLFSHGMDRRSPRIKGLLGGYLALGTAFSVYLSYAVYKWHEDVSQGIPIPTYNYILLPLLALIFIQINFILAHQILRVKKIVISMPLDELTHEKKAAYAIMSNRIAWASVLFGIMFILLDIDIAFASRTIFSLVGWMIYFPAMILLYTGNSSKPTLK